MDLIFGLVLVDQVTGGRQMRRLARGWMGWESRSGRWLRVRGARALDALATRLDLRDRPESLASPPAAEAPVA